MTITTFKNLDYKALGVFVLGWLAGRFGPELYKVDLKKEVSLDQVFNFITGIIVAVLIGYFWQKNYGTTRAEKDLFLERLRMLQNRIDNSFELFNKIYIDERTDANPRNRPDVQEQFNLLVREIETSRRMAGNLEVHLKSLSPSHVKSIGAIRMELILYKNILTLKEYDEHYGNMDLRKAQASFDKLNEEMFDLMVSVNSY